MPRRRMRRKVGSQPNHNYFGPKGNPPVPEVALKIEEFEAIRLKDFQGLNQEEAAENMGISQPTFCRTLTSARKKISDALISGKALRIQGGDYRISSNGPR